MNKEYYYLDGKEQKGPYSIDQLKTLNLKSDTLIWEENFDDWQPLKEIDELKVLLKKTPPPPPPIIDTNVSSKKETISENEKVILGDSNVKLWTTFNVLFFSIVAIGFAAFIAYSLHNSKKTELKNQIYSKIDRVFNGKTVVLDGQISIAVGELRETGYDPDNKKKKETEKETEKEKKSKALQLFPDIVITTMHNTEWWEREKLYTIYEATSGGFKIKQLTRQNEDGFDIETGYSEDMGYKKPTRRYNQPEYIEWGDGKRQKIRDGYWSNTYRLSVRKCYREAFNYFTEEDRKSPGAYSPGKFVDITNFPDLSNEYFFMENTRPKQYSSSSVFSSEWESSGDHGANINNEDWAVYYKIYGKHYELAENKDATNKDLLTNLSIGVGGVFLFLIILLLSKPKFFRNLNIFGKRWENKSYNDQILYFEHSLLGKNKFTEIINEKVSKGLLKFADGGNTVNLSYPNKELFYKISLLQNDKLILISQKDNSIIEFCRVGSKHEVKKDAIENHVDENPTNKMND